MGGNSPGLASREAASLVDLFEVVIHGRKLARGCLYRRDHSPWAQGSVCALRVSQEEFRTLGEAGP